MIPKKFTLGAVEWIIKIDNKRLNDNKSYGISDYHTSEITIQDKVETHQRKDYAVEQTLYHEVIHSILDTMSEYDLSNNEKFVQGFSILLHQYEKTKE